MDLDSLMRGLGPIQDTMKKAESERATAQFDGLEPLRVEN